MTITEAMASTRDSLRLKHLSLSTERTYLHWLKQYLTVVKSQPADWTHEQRVESWLTTFAQGGYSAQTQNQAFNAVLYFYRHVLKHDLKGIDAMRAKRPSRIPYCPTRPEIAAIISNVRDTNGYPTSLIVKLLYACGLRVSEPLNLRLQDVQLDTGILYIRDAKHGKDRRVTVPPMLIGDLRIQVDLAVARWQVDALAALPVSVPDRIARKYPRAGTSREWAWLFPAHKPCRHPRTGETVRYRCLESAVQRAVRAASRAAGLNARVTPHCLRHAYATHTLDAGASVRDVQSALGHISLETTMRYCHPDAARVRSPIESIIPVTAPAHSCAAPIPA